MKFIVFIASFFFFLGGASSSSLAKDIPGCHLDRNVAKETLNLDFQQFDQTERSGWRSFYKQACYKEASQLIQQYIFHKSGTKMELTMLHFHLGQMHGLYGNYSDAILSMKKAYRDSESKLINWNAFVSANIAFLEKDIDTLKNQKDLINLQPIITSDMKGPESLVGKKLNLDVVEGFIACFNQSYEQAYSDICRSKHAK